MEIRMGAPSQSVENSMEILRVTFAKCKEFNGSPKGYPLQNVGNSKEILIGAPLTICKEFNGNPKGYPLQKVREPMEILRGTPYNM